MSDELVLAESSSGAGLFSTTKTTEGTADTVLSLPGLSLLTNDVIVLNFYCPWWGSDTTDSDSFLAIFKSTNGGAAASVGTIWSGRAWGSSIQLGNIEAQYPGYVPGAGTHVFFLRAYTSSGTTFFIDNGSAGVANDVPMYLRLTQVA